MTLVIITTIGVSVGKILKKKNVLTISRVTNTHIKLLHTIWKGPKMFCNTILIADPQI